MHVESGPFAEACQLAEGQPVEILTAASVQPDMTILHDGRFLPVKFVTKSDRSVQIDLLPPEPNGTACRIVTPSTTIYCLGTTTAAQ